MGCRKTTKAIILGLAKVFTPTLIQYAVAAVEVLSAAGENNPDVLTNDAKRAAAAAAIKARWTAETGVAPKDHLVYLLIEYALTAVKSSEDQSQLGVDDSATDPA